VFHNRRVRMEAIPAPVISRRHGGLLRGAARWYGARSLQRLCAPAGASARFGFPGNQTRLLPADKGIPAPRRLSDRAARDLLLSVS